MYQGVNAVRVGVFDHPRRLMSLIIRGVCMLSGGYACLCLSLFECGVCSDVSDKTIRSRHVLMYFGSMNQLFH